MLAILLFYTVNGKKKLENIKCSQCLLVFNWEVIKGDNYFTASIPCHHFSIM